MLKNKLKGYLVVVLISVGFSGCASMGDLGGKGSSIRQVYLDNGTEAAQLKVQEKLNKNKDQLLQKMLLGQFDYEEGRFQSSNDQLAMADRISEDLGHGKVIDLKVLMSSPLEGDYRGSIFEKVFLHYYSALNYLFLAHEGEAQRQENMEGARIEARKVDILLTSLKNEEGDYQEVADKKESTFSKLLNIFDALQGKSLDDDWLVYREDAYIRYISGLVYEINAEFDEARVAYQQAAKLYESGYVKQYQLDDAMTEQAWLDTLRMMRRAGGYENEWPELARQKLSSTAQARLQAFNANQAELVLITHAGLLPKREQMNIKMTLDTDSKELVLSPFLVGTDEEKQDQKAWFYTLYSDKGLLQLISSFQTRGLGGVVDSLQSKRISLALVWELATKVALPAAMSLPARVTVPYFRPSQAEFGRTEVWLDGEKQGQQIQAEALNQLALQGQLLNANKDLQMAAARELAKSVACIKLGSIAGMACKAAAALVSHAETRQWSTLPYSIQLQRIAIKPGQHQIKLSTPYADKAGVYHEIERTVHVKPGELVILQERVLSPRRLPSVAVASGG